MSLQAVNSICFSDWFNFWGGDTEIFGGKWWWPNLCIVLEFACRVRKIKGQNVLADAQTRHSKIKN